MGIWVCDGGGGVVGEGYYGDAFVRGGGWLGWWSPDLSFLSLSFFYMCVFAGLGFWGLLLEVVFSGGGS